MGNLTACKSPSDSAKSSGGSQVAHSYLHFYNKEEELRNEHILVLGLKIGGP